MPLRDDDALIERLRQAVEDHRRYGDPRWEHRLPVWPAPLPWRWLLLFTAIVWYLQAQGPG
jgi:hypothetical protein